MAKKKMRKNAPANPPAPKIVKNNNKKGRSKRSANQKGLSGSSGSAIGQECLLLVFTFFGAYFGIHGCWLGRTQEECSKKDASGKKSIERKPEVGRPSGKDTTNFTTEPNERKKLVEGDNSGLYELYAPPDPKKVEEMRKYWPNTSTKQNHTDETFWKHVWEKHGAMCKMACRDYLNKVFAKGKEMIDGGLSKVLSKMEDLRGQTLTVETLADAMLDEFGARPCIRVDDQKTPNVLKEVIFQFDMSLSTMQSYPPLRYREKFLFEKV